MSVTPTEFLKDVGSLEDENIDLAKTAIYLAAYKYQGRNLERYFNHLKKLVKDTNMRHAELLEAGASDDAETQVAALKQIIADQNNYIGDSEDYDNLLNADLIAVIDRAKGLPISLCILYIQVGRALDWDVEGLNIPGHFVVRVQKNGRRIIFDPFYGGGLLEAPQLREFVKRARGAGAELQVEYFESAKNREILVRLQNNIKLRQIDSEDYRAALETIERTLLIAPDEYRLLLDAGVLYSRIDQPLASIKALEGYIEKVPNPQHKFEAQMLLKSVRDSLN